MLALLAPQAALGAERGRSMASPNQSGSMAPALHMIGAPIPDMSYYSVRMILRGLYFRHARAGGHPGISSRSREFIALDSRFRGNDATRLTPHFHMDKVLFFSLS
jgi:hypothetical protein